MQSADRAATFLAIFDRELAPRLGHRASTFRQAFVALSQKTDPCIVETGCVRVPDNWAGDGQSSVMFDAFVDCCGGNAWCVDISEHAVEVARSLTHNVIASCGDSVSFLHRFDKPIDLLYLDSFDFDGNEPLKSATHHLYELCAAMKNLRPGSIVLVDDTSRRFGKLFGKGMLVAGFMDQVGIPVVFEGETQVAWML